MSRVTSIPFAATVVDDNLLDGTQQVTITATGAGIFGGTIQIGVTDYETLTLTVKPGSGWTS